MPPIHEALTNPGCRIAFVQDNFVQAGGGERVAEDIAKVLPTADIYTSVYVEKSLSPYMKTRRIVATWMQKLPNLKKYYRHYFLLYPAAMRGIPLENYDLVVSSCYGFAKMLRKRKGAIHVCYCHTPTRWIWRYDDYAKRETFGAGRRFVLGNIVRLLKSLDRKAADRTDLFLANSSVVAERIRDYYGREAEIMFPAIDCSRFTPVENVGDFYLIVSRLVPYKRVDLAIEACRRLGRKLIVIGAGPDRARLESIAGSETTFLGRAPDEVVADHLARCKAMLFPGEEDFGLTPLETNASGRPCIAYGHGGALDTVIPGVTGVLFPDATADSLMTAMLQSEEMTWDPAVLRKHAEAFDTHQFARALTQRLQIIVDDIAARKGMSDPAAAPLTGSGLASRPA